MWDNPRLLNAAANALIALVAAAVLYVGLQLLLRSPLIPLRELVVQGAPAHVSREALEQALGRIEGNFFAADLAQVRARLERVPWVRRVELRRVWPDRLEVHLEEHVALAHWGEDHLVNTFGEKFAGKVEQTLPMLAGPEGTEAEVTRRYRRFAEALAPLEDAPARVTLSARYAWQLRLASGLTLELGRDSAEPVEARLARFVVAWPDSVARLGRNVGHVDLRYPNGFALRVGASKG